MGIDQGTTGTAVLIFDESWNMVSRGYKEIKQFYPQPGLVEHDALEIWDSVLAAVDDAVGSADISIADVCCIGIDHEGESVVIWDGRTGEPIANTIVWQDRRTAGMANDLNERCGERIRAITGLHPDAYFSATKYKWLIDNTPRAKEALAEGALMGGNMDAWIAWKLSGGDIYVTDASTASRTMLYDIHKGDWSSEILDMLGLSGLRLPEVRDSFSVYGHTDPAAFFGARIAVSCILNDQQAALLGQGCLSPGAVKTTYGTGCFMLMNVGGELVLPDNGILGTVAWQSGGRRTYALDGGVYIAGAAVQWLRDGIGLIGCAANTEQLAIDAGSSDGLYFVPAFTGLAAPYWDSYARGMMIGITAGITREHIARATLEAIAYQVKDVLDIMADCAGRPFSAMRADGGASSNNFLMQFQSDILGIPIDIPAVTETTAFGAACGAALGAGEMRDIGEICSMWKPSRHFEPHMAADERDTLLHGWHRAVARARDWIEQDDDKLSQNRRTGIFKLFRRHK
jgi:glycerol kinase